MKKKSLILVLISCITLAKAQTWHTMGAGVTNPANNANVGSITYYNGKIAIGGRFKSSNSTILNAIAQWDGNQWNPLGTGLWHSGTPDFAGGGTAITLYNNLIYIGGGFEVAGGVSSTDLTHSAGNIAKWDGSQWLPMTQWGMD